MPAEVRWQDVSIEKLRIGDHVRVKLDAYSGEVGDIHNGRYCAVLGLGNGDVIVKSIDGILPKLEKTHHSPYVLERRLI